MLLCYNINCLYSTDVSYSAASSADCKHTTLTLRAVWVSFTDPLTVRSFTDIVVTFTIGLRVTNDGDDSGQTCTVIEWRLSHVLCKNIAYIFRFIEHKFKNFKASVSQKDHFIKTLIFPILTYIIELWYCSSSVLEWSRNLTLSLKYVIDSIIKWMI